MAWETWMLSSSLWSSSRNSQLWASGTTIVGIVAAAWYAFYRRRRSCSASQDSHTQHAMAKTEGDKKIEVTYPQTECFFINSRGVRIHFRHYLPANITLDNVCGIIFFLHGYAAHCNRIAYEDFAKLLNAEGFAVVFLDHQGHGFSGPDERCVIKNAHDLVADVLQLIGLFCDPASSAKHASHNLGLPSSGASVLRSLPFFVAGQSMGGGLTIATGLALRKGDNRVLKDKFRGVMLHCPLICMDLPPWPVKLALKWILAPIAGTRSMPAFMDSTMDLNQIWATPEIIAKVKADTLGFKDSVRWCTAVALVNLSEYVQKNISNVDFPFVTLHDPDDKVVKNEGSELLMSASSTPDSLKEYHKMAGYKHDLIMNCSNVCAPILAAFGRKVLAAL